MFTNIFRGKSLLAVAERFSLKFTNPQMNLTKYYHILRPLGLTKLNNQLSTQQVSKITPYHELLRPTSLLLNNVCGFKVKGRLKRRCKDCYFVVREERMYVICKTHPRHKQMSMKPSEKKSWILTHATQSAVRPY